MSPTVTPPAPLKSAPGSPANHAARYSKMSTTETAPSWLKLARQHRARLFPGALQHAPIVACTHGLGLHDTPMNHVPWQDVAIIVAHGLPATQHAPTGHGFAARHDVAPFHTPTQSTCVVVEQFPAAEQHAPDG